MNTGKIFCNNSILSFLNSYSSLSIDSQDSFWNMQHYFKLDVNKYKSKGLICLL